VRLGVVPAGRGGSAKARFPPWMGVAAPVAAAYLFSGSRLGRSGILLRCVSQVTLALRISSLLRLPCQGRAGGAAESMKRVRRPETTCTFGRR
jgi:hypothetical protein